VQAPPLFSIAILKAGNSNVSNLIQDLLRDKPPVMVFDMGLGSREQSLPVHDSEPMRVIGSGPADLGQFRPSALACVPQMLDSPRECGD
jgi:hypothetical protein